MAPFVDPSFAALVYAGAREVREHIYGVLPTSMLPVHCVAELDALTAWLRRGESAIAVVVLAKDTDGSVADVDAQEFRQIVTALEQWHKHRRFAQSILVSPRDLPLGESCQAVLAGVSSLVRYDQAGFDEHLLEHFNGAYDYARRRCDEGASGFLQDDGGLVGASEALAQLKRQAQQASRVSDAPVIVYGESGTGKQRLAELVHAWDEKRCCKPFVAVNCAAITGTLAESELFGHKRGAFTGASDDRPGYFRAAHGGTILLDEISELEPALQPKILRVLQEKLIMPVGSDQEYPLDVRVIAATNRDLDEMVSQGRFRLDLYQRLNVIQLRVPPLRERVEDIPALFEAFIEKYAHYCTEPVTSVNPAVYEIIGRNLGAGNIRELENIVRRILVFKEGGGRVEITDLPRNMLEAHLQRPRHARTQIPDELIESLLSGKKQLTDAIDEYEQVVLNRLLQRGLPQSTLAERLGVTRRTLYNKIHKHGIS